MKVSKKILVGGLSEILNFCGNRQNTIFRGQEILTFVFQVPLAALAYLAGSNQQGHNGTYLGG